MMSLFDVIDLLIDGRKITKPIFTKDFSSENSQLTELTELAAKLKPGTKKNYIERDIAFIKQGIEGEKNVAFELRNSFLPILCLHDIRLEFEDYVAQFDFIVISNKFICILETKKLNGDIEITSDGDFIRIIRGYDGRFIKKVGMYSPISQNERHVNILKEILSKEKLIRLLPLKSLVVMANPKSILNKNKCPKTIQNNIYKYDQVITYLTGLQKDKTNDIDMLEKYMYRISDFLIANNKPLQIDNYTKYGLSAEDFIKEAEVKAPLIQEKAATYNADPQDVKVADKTEKNGSENNDLHITYQDKGNSEVIAALKKYRLEISRTEGLKPYMIFNDKELASLLETNPKSSKELLAVRGFAEKKVAKYGDEIIKILHGNNT
jgi:hypothetical protein